MASGGFDFGGPRTARAPGALGAVTAIALNTFREAIRDRILYLLLVFALVLIATSRLLSIVTVGNDAKILKDLGLSAISIFGVLTSVFVGVSLVYKEIDKRTIYTLLASPVRRWHFLVGKYAGLLAVVGMNVAVMSAAFLLLLAARGESTLPILPAILLILVQLALVTAFAILFSSFTNPMLSAVGTLAVYVVGQLAWSFDLLKQRLPEGLTRRACDVLYYLLPNLDRLDLKMRAVHGLPVPAWYVPMGLAYGICYAALVLLLACLVFEHRDFV